MSPDTGRQPDPSKPTQIVIVGKKGFGKTELGWLLFESYPYDRVLIDPNADIKVDPEKTVTLDEIPSRWPSHLFEKGERATVRYIPDFGATDYLDQIDRAVGMAYAHGPTVPTCVFIDEAHEALPAGRTPPHCRRALRQGRHQDLSLIFATPRPMTSDPLMTSQADWVYAFKLPNPADRRRVAENIGWDPKEFDAAIFALEKFEYLRYDSAEDDLAHFPPLPEEKLAHHKG